MARKLKRKRKRKVKEAPPVSQLHPVHVWEYRPGRSVRRGDRLKVGGGPVFVDEAGNRHLFGERGVFVFLGAFPEKEGGDWWIIAGGKGLTVLIPSVPKVTKYSLPGYVPRPYRFRRLRSK